MDNNTMNSGLIIHIPHASTIIPEDFLCGLHLDREELAQEIIWATDAYCDELFDAGHGARIIAPYSRLACDVERFQDDNQEPSAKSGNGLLYTHTQRGKKIREPDAVLREKALLQIYNPHHAELSAAVDKALEEHGSCLIIDGHSFCDDSAVGTGLPDFCIGSDDYHTPEKLVETARLLIKEHGYSVAFNYPYSGTIVPMKHFMSDKRVFSLMIEVNKRLYLKDGTMNKSDNFHRIKQVCNQVVCELEKVTIRR